MPVPSIFGVYVSRTSGGGGSTTINPLDCSTSINLSGGNLTGTRNSVTTGRWVSARSTTSRTTGKFYFETTRGAFAASAALGLANATYPIDNGGQNVVGNDAAENSIGYDDSGQIQLGGSVVDTAASWTTPGQVAEIAVDLTGRLFWARISGGSWNGVGGNPATGTGGIAMAGPIATGGLFVGISLFGTNDAITVNFGATAFTGTVPVGFSAWG